MIHLDCPSCNAPYDLDERRLPKGGMQMRCPKCGTSFPVRPPGAVEAAAPEAPKPAAPARRPPLAPAFPGVPNPPPAAASAPAALELDELDLPAPKRARGPFEDLDELDLPAPKVARAAAPAVPEILDLPAPKKAGAIPLDEIDLPVPKKAGTSPLDELDLPVPKKAGTSPLDELDLPTPKSPSAPKPPVAPPPSGPKAPPVVARPAPAAPPIPAPIVDLPTPKGAGPAPAAKRPIATPLAGSSGLDLPAPKAPAVPSAKGKAGFQATVDLDFPTPRGGGALDELDLPAPLVSDLPAPRRGRGALDELDLPALLASDLPAPRRGGGALDELDLPAPLASDLPARRGGGALDELDLPAPLASDLPAPRAAGVDLPALRISDLPAPRAGGVDLPAPRISDLPSPRAGGIDLPASRISDLPAARRTPFDDLLGEPSGSGANPFDLPMPDSLPPPPRDSMGAGGGFGLDVPPPRAVAPAVDEDDDLALPEPRDRAAKASGAPLAKKGAGGTGFGELDLGGGDGGDELEFAGLEEESPPATTGGLDDLPDPMAASEQAALRASTPSATKSVRGKAATAKKAKPVRRGRSLVALAAVLVLLVAAGGALHFTPYGLFGIYVLEQHLPEAGTEADARRVIEHAERRAASDAYADVRAALAELAVARRSAGLNRTLLVRSLVHEALFQVRFGEDAASAARAARILARLEERAALVSDMAVARAADELRRGEEPRSLAAARRLARNDAYLELLAGESALRRGDGSEARDAFAAALAHGGGARAQWGLARAAILLDDASKETAIDATLALSAAHVAALAAKADVVLGRGEADEALALARRAAGLEPNGGAPAFGAARERAAAFAVLGRAEEARSHRAEARAAYERALALDPYRVDALLGAGRVLLREGQPRDALARFEAALEAIGATPTPSSAALAREAKLGRAEALLRVDRPVDARTSLDALAAEWPEDPNVALWRGRALAAVGEAEPAVGSFRRAIELAPGRFEAYMALAQHYFAADQPAEAAEVLRAAQAHVAPTAEVHRMLGESLIRRNDLAAAEIELRRALALDAQDRGALFSLGVVERRSGRLDTAEQTFERLATLDPTYPGLSLERASIYEARGQSDRAVEALSRALETSPDDAELKLRLAAAQVAAGQLDGADATLAGLLAGDSPSAMAIYYHGRVAFARGELAPAIDRFRRAIELDRERAEFHVQLASAYFERGNLSGASSEVETTLGLDEGNGDAYLIRARIHVRTGQVRDALEDAQRALAQSPDRHDAYAVMGDAYEQLGRGRDAVKAYEEAVGRRPAMGEWWYRLGRLRLDASDRDGALAALARAAELGDREATAPHWLADAHRVKAEVHRLRREHGPAERHYERYLALAPATALDVADVRRRLAEIRRNR